MIKKIVDLMNRLGKEEKGLTLIELMIVLAIVAIIAALAVPQIVGYLTAAGEEAAEADAQSLTSAVQMWALQEDAQQRPDNFDPGDDANVAALEEYVDMYEIATRLDESESDLIHETIGSSDASHPFWFCDSDARVRISSGYSF